MWTEIDLLTHDLPRFSSQEKEALLNQQKKNSRRRVALFVPISLGLNKSDLFASS